MMWAPRLTRWEKSGVGLHAGPIGRFHFSGAGRQGRPRNNTLEGDSVKRVVSELV